MTVKIADILMHVRKKPIDHPESSILFKHLAKEVKEELLRLALSTLMNRALLNAETKDFYIILADVITTDYPLGYYETIERKPARTPITITEQSGNDLSDYAVKIELDDTWDGWDTVIDGSDIYFLDENGNPLYYWIEKFDKQNKHAIIWVKIPFLPANSSITIYMHYGATPNPYAEYNDPNQVFLFFDDFEQYDIGSDGSPRWTPINPGFYVDIDETKVYAKKGAEEGAFSIVADYIRQGNIIIEARIKHLDSYKLTEIIMDVPDDATRGDEGYMFVYGYNNKLSIYKEGTEVAYTSITVSANAWYEVQGGIYNNKVFARIKIGDTWYSVEYTDPSPLPQGHIGVRTGGKYTGEVDNYKVRPYTEPEPSVSIGVSEFTGVETTNLDFPDGIDKILVTIDSDAQEAYYSTDGGQTWNALTLDEEILLPETAYQLKLKFANLSYFRGYALIGW